MTAVAEDVEVRPAPAAPAVLLGALAAAVLPPVLLVGLLLLPVWAAVLVAVVVAGAVTGWAWARATHVVRALGGGTPVDPERHARLINVVDGLCLATGVPAPALEVVDDPAANALIAGRNERDAVLLVTTGLLDATDRVALEGAIAHQLVQLRDGGLASATLTVTTVGLPLLLVDRLLHRGDGAGGGVAALLGPATALSSLRRLGIGGDRQTWADLDAVAVTRYPPGLLAALEACRRTGTVVASGTRSTAHLWMAEPIATDERAGALAERNRAFVGPRSLDERIDILREL
ncbi:MAG: M48 family metalloprotease [Actinobacteria bacterium]|nr:M48 family metalloprotease [Actinomycetota bacterium]